METDSQQNMPVRQAARLAGWNEVVGSVFAGCVVDAPDQHFEGRLGTCQLDSLGIAKISAQPSKVRRWLRNRPAVGSGATLLHLQTAGVSISRQARRETQMKSWDGSICNPDDAYEIDFVTPYELFVLEVPDASIILRRPGFDIERAAGQPIETKRAKLLTVFVQAVWGQFSCLSDDAEWRESVSRMTMDLALQAMGHESPEATAGVSPAMRRMVIGYIRENFADPGLRAGGVAKALHVSQRSVQNVFESMSTTASAFILEQRLHRAAARLLAERRDVTVTHIAYHCGFNDSAYFSRCFHRYYGVSPTGYRGA